MDADEAYHSGLTVPTMAGEDLKKDESVEVRGPGSVTGNEDSGTNPLAGTPPKERSAMTKLFSGKPAVDAKGSGSGDPAIKQSAASSSKAKLNLAGTPGVMTPLAGRLQSISFQPQKPEGLASYSPTSDYGSGNFPSLPESGYSSMPSMPSLDKQEKHGESVEAQTSTESRMDVDNPASQIPEVSIHSADPTPTSKEGATNSMDISQASSFVPMTTSKSPSEASSFSSRESSSLSPAGPISMLVPGPVTAAVAATVQRSESPGAVPMVGEDVEIETDPPAAGLSGSSGHRHEGAKRSAMDSDLAPTTKNPRLSPEVMSKS